MQNYYHIKNKKMLQLITDPKTIMKNDVLVINTGSDIIVGVCTGTMTYPNSNNNVWFGLNAKKEGVTEGIVAAREYFGGDVPIFPRGGLLGFKKHLAIYTLVSAEV